MQSSSSAACQRVKCMWTHPAIGRDGDEMIGAAATVVVGMLLTDVLDRGREVLVGLILGAGPAELVDAEMHESRPRESAE